MTGATDITTGIDEVDQDIKTLFELIQSERLQGAKSALADQTLSLAKLEELLPEGVIRLGLALTDPAGFAILMERCKEDARKQLEHVRTVFQDHFAELRSHPAIIELLKEVISQIELKDKPESLRLNSVTGIGYMPM